MAPSVTVESVSPAASHAVIASLYQLLGDRLSTAALVREKHGKDASWHPWYRRTPSHSHNQPRK